MAVLLCLTHFTSIQSSLNHWPGFVEDSETVAPPFVIISSMFAQRRGSGGSDSRSMGNGLVVSPA